MISIYPAYATLAVYQIFTTLKLFILTNYVGSSHSPGQKWRFPTVTLIHKKDMKYLCPAVLGEMRSKDKLQTEEGALHRLGGEVCNLLPLGHSNSNESLRII